jgi:YebC/PmpR family DNA-binding regulatory protein
MRRSSAVRPLGRLPLSQPHVSVRGAGHSKWANIKHQKSRGDAERAKLYNRLARDITSAVRVGGPDTSANTALVGALSRARRENMPKKNIESAIASGTRGHKDGAAEETIFYEALGPGGVSILIKISTDNRNRTNQFVKHALTSNGGSPGSSAFAFTERGVLSFPADDKSEEELLELAFECGAEDMERVDASGPNGETLAFFLCARTDLISVKNELEGRGVEVQDAEVCFLPTQIVAMDEVDEGVGGRMQAVVDALENVDEVTSVSTNFEALLRYPFVVTE